MLSTSSEDSVAIDLARPTLDPREAALDPWAIAADDVIRIRLGVVLDLGGVVEHRHEVL